MFSVSHDLNGGPRDQAIIYLDGAVPGGPEGTNFLSSERNFLDEVRESDFGNAVGYVHVATLPAGRHSFTNTAATVDDTSNGADPTPADNSDDAVVALTGYNVDLQLAIKGSDMKKVSIQAQLGGNSSVSVVTKSTDNSR